MAPQIRRWKRQAVPIGEIEKEGTAASAAASSSPAPAGIQSSPQPAVVFSTTETTSING